MSRCFRRAILGAAVIAGTTASAQPYPADSTSSSERFVANASESYAVDDADTEVIEFPRDANAAPVVTSAPMREAAQVAQAPYASETYADRSYAERFAAEDERRVAQAELACAQFDEAVAARGQTQAAHGTVCQQQDGSWRIVSAPAMDAHGNSLEGVTRLRAVARPVQNTCREYQQTIVANGRQRQAYGEACLQPDGSWRVVTPPSWDGVVAERRADYTPAPRHITSASMRAQERDTRREERVYSERTYARRHSPLYNLFFGWMD